MVYALYTPRWVLQLGQLWVTVLQESMQYGMQEHKKHLKWKINVSSIKSRQMKWAWMKGEKYRHGNMVRRYGLDSSHSGQRPVVGASEYCHDLYSFIQNKQHLERWGTVTFPWRISTQVVNFKLSSIEWQDDLWSIIIIIWKEVDVANLKYCLTFSWGTDKINKDTLSWLLMSGLRFEVGTSCMQKERTWTKLFAVLLCHPLKAKTTSHAIANFTCHCNQPTVDSGFLVKKPELLTQYLLYLSGPSSHRHIRSKLLYFI